MVWDARLRSHDTPPATGMSKASATIAAEPMPTQGSCNTNGLQGPLTSNAPRLKATLSANGFVHHSILSKGIRGGGASRRGGGSRGSEVDRRNLSIMKSIRSRLMGHDIGGVPPVRPGERLRSRVSPGGPRSSSATAGGGVPTAAAARNAAMRSRNISKAALTSGLGRNNSVPKHTLMTGGHALMHDEVRKGRRTCRERNEDNIARDASWTKPNDLYATRRLIQQTWHPLSLHLSPKEKAELANLPLTSEKSELTRHPKFHKFRAKLFTIGPRRAPEFEMSEIEKVTSECPPRPTITIDFSLGPKSTKMVTIREKTDA